MKTNIKIIILSLLLTITFLCYAPGLHSYFQFDDVHNIVKNDNLLLQKLDGASIWQAAMSGSAGALQRPISMLSLGLNYYFTGLDAYYFKITNLIIHLINGVLVYFLSGILLRSYKNIHNPNIDEKSIDWVTLSTTALWLLHPINTTSILYVVQRMASLAALFVLIGLILYLLGRKRLTDGRQGGFLFIAAAFLICTPLAILCKENGALLPLMLLLLEITLLNWQTKSNQSRKALAFIFSIIVGLPLLLAIVYVILHPELITATYPFRDFTLPERLLTESRVIWFYLRLILVPDISAFGFYHDDIAISHGLINPVSTLPAITGITFLLFATYLLRKRHPLFSFGVLFFLLGHSLESSVFALELVYEHRNYLPSYGIILTLTYYLVSSTVHPSSIKLRKIVMVVFLLLVGAVTTIRAQHWGNPYELKLLEAEYHPNSVRAHADLGFFFSYLPSTSSEDAQNHFNLANEHFQKAFYLSNTDTLGLFGLIKLNAERGINLDISWWNELAARLEHVPFSPNSANLLVAMQQCHSSGKCKFSSELMEKELNAAMRNPTLYGERKSEVLFAWAAYLFETKHLPEDAVQAAYDAVKATPLNINNRIYLITFLDALGKPEKALNELEKAKALDKLGAFTPTLNDIKQNIQIKIRNLDKSVLTKSIE